MRIGQSLGYEGSELQEFIDVERERAKEERDTERD